MVEATREVFGDIPGLIKITFYIAAAAALFVFFAGSWIKVSIWARGREDVADYVSKMSAFELIRTSILYLFSADCLLVRRVMDKSRLRGVMLIFIYWGFIILFIGTLIVAVDYDLGLKILKGSFYLIYSLILDIAGGLALISLTFYLLRRYVFSARIVVSNWDDAVVLILMFLIILSGFCIEGSRLARFAPPLMDWSPVGALFASLIKTSAGDQASLLLSYRIFWVFHALSSLTFIAYLPFSKQFHMFAAQITTLEASRRKKHFQEVVHG